MLLRLSRDEKAKVALLVKGLCAPEATEGIYTENWRVVTAERLLPGDYSLEALFVDNSKRAWFETTVVAAANQPCCPPRFRWVTLRSNR